MKSLFLAMILATTLTGGSIYDFKVAGLDGSDIDFSQFKGKKIMIVNTASMCGNTPQYKDLETLYEKYKDKLVIVGFPANNFGAQEPGTNEEIKQFCTKEYSVHSRWLKKYLCGEMIFTRCTNGLWINQRNWRRVCQQIIQETWSGGNSSQIL